MSFAPLILPGSVGSPFEFFLYPVCFYTTWMAFQRNLKLSKWNPDLENLDRRIPSAVGINLAFPLLLITILVALGYLNTTWSTKKTSKPKRELSNVDDLFIEPTKGKAVQSIEGL